MNQPRQQQYLEALDIPAWVRKEYVTGSKSGFEAVASGLLTLGPGSGHLLLVCGDLNEPASRLAADIARSLVSEPVWAWPAEDSTESGGQAPADIETTVREYLFTSVVVLGDALAESLFSGDVPETLGSARVVSAPAMAELASSPAARMALWDALRDNRLAGKRVSTGR
jgi:DNA polymerase III psi subunit